MPATSGQEEPGAPWASHPGVALQTWRGEVAAMKVLMLGQPICA